MDAVVSAIISSIFSGVVVGIFLIKERTKVEGDARKIDENQDLKFNAVHSKLDRIEEDERMTKLNVEKMAESFISMKVSVSNLDLRCKFLEEKLVETNSIVRNINDRQTKHFGKVVVKP